MLKTSIVVASAFVAAALVLQAVRNREAPTAPPVTCQLFPLTVHVADSENPDIVLPPGYVPLGAMEALHEGIGVGVMACTKP